jgi:antirestriction protein
MKSDGTEPITNAEDVIDSRDVIARIAYLEEASEDLTLPLDEDERAELEALRSLAKEAADYAPDWEYGETLVRESYFEDYARDFADDIGAITPDTSWPMNCIDWEQAARELAMDYTHVDFDGVTYLIR